MERNQNNPNSWSELPQDIMISVFERLRFADYTRAKSVCASWQSASRLSVATNHVPWLIIFPKKKNSTCLTLFNPEENDKLYKTQALGVEFAEGDNYKATYGSWLLMQDPRWNLYIVNLFTHEIISLPPMESQLGMTKVERTEKDLLVIFDQVSSTYRYMKLRSPVFWIDEKTKDYIVLCALDRWSVIYTKRGDNFWNQIPEISACTSMVYKDHKLYFTGFRNTFTILDFSGHIPQRTFQCNSRVLLWNKIVVTITGDVLMVQNDVRRRPFMLFRIFKIYSSSSGFLQNYELVKSLGDETMLLDLGITVFANKFKGLRRNSIYFGGNYCLKKDLFIFNLETQKVERLHKIDFDSSLCGGARWFLPSFTCQV